MARERKSAGRGQTIHVDGYRIHVTKGRAEFVIHRHKTLPPVKISGKRLQSRRK